MPPYADHSTVCLPSAFIVKTTAAYPLGCRTGRRGWLVALNGRKKKKRLAHRKSRLKQKKAGAKLEFFASITFSRYHQRRATEVQLVELARGLPLCR